MDLRSFDNQYAALVAGCVSSAQEVSMVSGRDQFPFPGELLTPWRSASDDIKPYLFFVGQTPIGYGQL